MNPEKEDVLLVVRRFKWLDNLSIRIMSMEGIEKTLNILDDFSNISYCHVPMFDYEQFKENPYHIYYESNSIEKEETLRRL